MQLRLTFYLHDGILFRTWNRLSARSGGQMRIEINCAKCGQNRFTIVEGMADDAAVISCSDCGHHIGTMAELKERIAAEVLRRRSHDPSPHAEAHEL